MHATIFNTLRIALILALLSPKFALAQAASATVTRAAAPSIAQAEQVVDDDAINSKITTRGAALLADKKTVAMEKLLKQLEKAASRAVVALPPGAVAGPAAAPLTPAQIYSRCQPGVLVIAGLYKDKETGDWLSSVSTGFAINTRGAVVTCHHVIKASDQVTIVAMTRDGKVLPVTRVIAASVADDLAIIEVPGLDVPPLPLAVDPPVGSDVCVVSHPDGRYYSLARGYVTRYSVITGEHGRTTILETSAEFAGGSSGGPVINDRGAVVGIVASTMDAYSDAPASPDANAPADPGSEKKKPEKPDKQAKSGKPDDKDKPDPNAPPPGPELQMVFKECVPVSKLLAMLEPEAPAVPAPATPAAAPASK